MLMVMSFLVQLWNGTRRSERRQPGEPNPYPVIAVVDNRARAVDERFIRPDVPELLAA